METHGGGVSGERRGMDLDDVESISVAGTCNGLHRAAGGWGREGCLSIHPSCQTKDGDYRRMERAVQELMDGKQAER